MAGTATFALDAPTVRIKLGKPRLPRGVVRRDRLELLLDEASRRARVTLVCAPVGYGKSVLVSSWLSRPTTPRRWGWVTLDRADGDSRRLWNHVLAALQRACGKDSGADAASLQQLVQPPVMADLDLFLDRMFAALDELTQPLVLVLDDVHELVAGPEAMTVLDRFIRFCPAQVRFVLCSRFDPPLTLQRLRLGDDLAQLRQRDLAFTEAESVEVMRRSGVRLGSADLVAVHEKAEGWPAAVRLAALSLHGSVDPSASVQSIIDRDRSIADYLAGEVLAGLPDPLREFLLRATVSDQVCGPLVDALTGGSDGAAMLAECERLNLFLSVVHDDPPHVWYAWHHMLAAQMRRRLVLEDTAAAAELALRAARWWRDVDAVVAVHHAMDGGDLALAREIVADGWLGLTLRGEAETVLDLVGRSAPAGDGGADLMLARCLAHFQLGDVASATSELSQAMLAAAHMEASRRPLFDARATVVRLLLVNDQTALADAIAAGRALLSRLSGSVAGSWTVDTATRALVLLAVGTGESKLMQDPPGAVALLEAARAAGAAAGLPVVELLARAELTLPLMAAGDLTASEATARDILDEAKGRGWQRLGALATTHTVLGWLAYLRNDLPAARGHLDAGRAVALPTDWAVRGLLHGVRFLTALAGGDRDQAFRELASARSITRMGGMPPYWPGLLATVEALWLQADGDGPGAMRKALTVTGGPTYWIARCLRADLHRRAGRLEEALAELGVTRGSPIPPHTAASIQVIRALVLDGKAQGRQAHLALEAALGAAVGYGLVEPFASHAAELRPMLTAHLDFGTAFPEFLMRLLQDSANRRSGRSARSPLVNDLLTTREVSVLNYMRTALSYAEIASELYVSVNTVKTHVGNIYRKVGVDSRRDAVRAAHELGLFEAAG